MNRWWFWLAVVVVVAFAAGLAVGRVSLAPEVVTKTEVREVVRTVEAKAIAEAHVKVVEVAGPTVTRWRTAPAAPGCPEVREVEQVAGPVQRVIQEASRIAVEQATKEVTREVSTESTVAGPAWWAAAFVGITPARLPERAWFAGAVVQRRIIGPLSLGVVGSYGAGRGAEVGAALGWSW